MNNKTDRELVLEYRAGNKQALTILVKRWHKEFCLKAFYVVKDAEEAKDIAQDTWRVILDKLDDLDQPERFRSWALRIVYTKSIDLLRAKQRKHKFNQSYERHTRGLDEPKIDDSRIKEVLINLIQSLPIAQQTVLKLFYVQEYTLKEIADILTIKYGTVKSRLFHARETLKTILKNKYYEN